MALLSPHKYSVWGIACDEAAETAGPSSLSVASSNHLAAAPPPRNAPFKRDRSTGNAPIPDMKPNEMFAPVLTASDNLVWTGQKTGVVRQNAIQQPSALARVKSDSNGSSKLSRSRAASNCDLQILAKAYPPTHEGTDPRIPSFCPSPQPPSSPQPGDSKRAFPADHSAHDRSFSPVTLARASESAPIPQFGPSVRVHSPLGDQTISRSKGASNETNDSDDASDLDDQYAELANWEAEVVIRGVGELTMDDVRVLCFRQNIKADDKSLVAHAVDGKKLLRFKNASTLMKLIGSTVFALCSLKPRDFCCISLHLHGIWFDDVQIRRRHVSAEDGASVGN
eukprot:m.217845 g.217845  ORF g.217845 m.217845 type:complete len:338 (-) comp54113_c0_seq28:482-1495(-)